MSNDGWALSSDALSVVKELSPQCILELGSGQGSLELAKICPVYSVEHDRRFINNQSDIVYLFCPIKDMWYRADALKIMLASLPTVDLLIIDGPPGTIGRAKILEHLDLFNLSANILVDDIHRNEDKAIFDRLASLLPDRTRKTFNFEEKSFGVIYA